MHRGFQRVGTTTIVAEILLLPSFISMAFVASQLNKLRNQYFIYYTYIHQTKQGAKQSFLSRIFKDHDTKPGLEQNQLGWLFCHPHSNGKVRNRTLHCKQKIHHFGNGMGTQIN